MEILLVWLLRFILKLFRIDRNRFLVLLAHEAGIDFLPLAYSQRGILKCGESLSGEAYLLKEVLAPLQAAPVTIFDVGANVGKYTEAVHRNFPNARIFSFEPNPQIIKQLKKRVAGYAEIVEAAVGEENGTIQLFNCAAANRSQHGSVYPEALTELHGYQSIEQVTVNQITLDAFAGLQNIETIHLLKIDTEGHELSVLKGCRKLLEEKRIINIQFEFNEMNIVSRVFLKDFFDLLSDYEFYRLDTASLHPLTYTPREEIFQFQNFLCMQKRPAPRGIPGHKTQDE